MYTTQSFEGDITTIKAALRLLNDGKCIMIKDSIFGFQIRNNLVFALLFAVYSYLWTYSFCSCLGFIGWIKSSTMCHNAVYVTSVQKTLSKSFHFLKKYFNIFNREIRHKFHQQHIFIYFKQHNYDLYFLTLSFLIFPKCF